MAEPYVGRPMPRREDSVLLRGRGRYIDDIEPEGVLHARFVRSPHAHAVIKGIATKDAAALPGVFAVYTAGDLDIPDLTPPLEIADAAEVGRPILARDRILFSGEAYALVLASNPYIAEDGADLVEIDAEPLPAVMDPLAFRQGASNPLHPGLATNVVYDHVFDGGPVDEVFADADVVFDARLRSPRQTALPMECRGLVADPSDGVLTVFASTQMPHMLHRAIADSVSLPMAHVRVEVPDVGGAFGLKAHVYPEEIAIAAAALRLGRPVKWVEDRADNLTSSCHARDQWVDVRVAADAHGRLRALDVDLVCDVGAYGVYAHGHVLEAAGTPSMIPGPYQLQAYRFRSRAVATNKCPEGGYRGVGLPVSTFVHERVMDLLAAETGIDRAEVRRRNLIRADQMPYRTLTGQTYDSGDYGQALDKALAEIGYDNLEARRQEAAAAGRLLGLGLACYVEYTAPGSAVFGGRGMKGLAGYDDARITIAPDGGATVWTSLPAAGQGLATTFAQIAADALHLHPDDITISSVDTGVGDVDGSGTFGSRSAVVGGGAIASAGEELMRRLVEDASEMLEVAPTDLTVSDGAVSVVGLPTEKLTFGQIVARQPEGRYAVARRFDPRQSVYPSGVHACIVEVQPATGAVRIVRYVIVDDSGVVINPLVVEGQVCGAVAQGLAGALYESLVYDDGGQLLTASLMDYLVPTASDLTAFEIHPLSIPSPASGNGSKGAGESGTLAPGATIASAVSDAVGTACNILPVSVEWLRTAARERMPSFHPASTIRETAVR